MICPTCKAENPAHSVCCSKCGTALGPSKDDEATDGQIPGPVSDLDKSKPSSVMRPSSRMDRQADRRTDGMAPAVGSPSRDGSGVSISSKTPSGSVPLDDRTMEDSDPSAFREEKMFHRKFHRANILGAGRAADSVFRGVLNPARISGRDTGSSNCWVRVGWAESTRRSTRSYRAW